VRAPVLHGPRACARQRAGLKQRGRRQARALRARELHDGARRAQQQPAGLALRLALAAFTHLDCSKTVARRRRLRLRNAADLAPALAELTGLLELRNNENDIWIKGTVHLADALLRLTRLTALHAQRNP
jgi:hypothetical protein